MKKIELFINLLKEIINCIEYESNQINANGTTKWNMTQLKKVVLPEMNELLLYALKGKVLFKYGRHQRLLESTYLMTDSLDNLEDTTLGEKITELQKLYNSL